MKIISIVCNRCIHHKYNIFSIELLLFVYLENVIHEMQLCFGMEDNFSHRLLVTKLAVFRVTTMTDLTQIYLSKWTKIFSRILIECIEPAILTIDLEQKCEYVV